MKLCLLLLLPAILAQDMMTTINDPRNVQAVLDSMPKECKKNGKTYKEGEKFEIGRLRYQCQKYGVYSIEGCRTEKNETMAIGQTMVKNNIAHQCLASGNSIYYRETTCGILGQPDCDKVPKPTGFQENAKKDQPKGKEITIAGLPRGWKVLEEGTKKIPGTNATIISRTLMFNPVDHSRARRQTGVGVGRVIGMEDVGTDKPPMPMEMLMGGKKVTDKPSTAGHHGEHMGANHHIKSAGGQNGGNAAAKGHPTTGSSHQAGAAGGKHHEAVGAPGTVGQTHAGHGKHHEAKAASEGGMGGNHESMAGHHGMMMGGMQSGQGGKKTGCCGGHGGMRNSAHHNMPDDKAKGRFTQDIGTSLKIVGQNKETRETQMKPGTVGGSRSDVNWHGKTISVNGKQIAAGPGTFSFGTSPTGAFLKKDPSH